MGLYHAEDSAVQIYLSATDDRFIRNAKAERKKVHAHEKAIIAVHVLKNAQRLLRCATHATKAKLTLKPE